MDKNQSVIVMVIIVLVVVSIFLYFVFRINTDTADENFVEEDDGAYTFDVDADRIDTIGSEMSMDDSVQVIDSEIKKEAADIAVNYDDAKEIDQSPETGPGFIAVIIAAVLAAFAGFGVYKKGYIKNS